MKILRKSINRMNKGSKNIKVIVRRAQVKVGNNNRNRGRKYRIGKYENKRNDLEIEENK